MNHSIITIFFLIMFYFASCSYAADIVKIIVEPEFAVVENASPQKTFVVKGIYSDGTEEPIHNTDAIFTISNTDIATISKEGILSAWTNGSTSMKINYKGMESYAGITVNLENPTAIDSDNDGQPDSSDPIPYISTSTSTSIKVSGIYTTYAQYTLLDGIIIDTSASGTLNNYILTEGAKVSGYITNNSSTNLQLLAAYLIVPESNYNSYWISFDIANRKLYSIAGTSSESLLGGEFFSPGETIGLVSTLSQNVDIRGYGIRWLWIANYTSNGVTKQIWIVSNPPIVSDYDNDSILDHIDPDDDNDGIFDIEELENNNFLNKYNAPYVAKFLAKENHVKPGAPVNFVNHSTGPDYESFWSFSDGQTSREVNPSHIFNTPGIYDVQLTVYKKGDLIPTSEGGEQTKLREDYIYVSMEGDVDYSGTIDLNDTITSLNTLVNDQLLPSINRIGTDINGDNKIGLAEAIHSLRTYSSEHLPPASCDYGDLTTCTTENDCNDARGHWWSNNTCLGVPEEETVVSAGQIWMDRNLGAYRAATSLTDTQAYGDLYQWGRAADGHQIRTSLTTSTSSYSDTPGHNKFITNDYPWNWRIPDNDILWQGVKGTNNPCPSGFRLPTAAEFEKELASWSSKDSTGAYDSPLKLLAAGYRYNSNGEIMLTDSFGSYWTSTSEVIDSWSGQTQEGMAKVLHFRSSASVYYYERGRGHSVRCIKD